MEQLRERQTNIIRRLCVGPDYFKSMKYTAGSSCLRDRFVINEILEIDPDTFEIHIENDDKEVFLWKTIRNMPVCVEFNIDFE